MSSKYLTDTMRAFLIVSIFPYLISCSTILEIPIVSKDITHGVALHKNFTGSVESYSFISKMSCKDHCYSLSKLGTNELTEKKYEQYTVKIMGFTELEKEKFGISINYNLKIFLLKKIDTLIKLLFNDLDLVYKDLEKPIQVIIYLLPSNSLITNKVIKSTSDNGITFHFGFYTSLLNIGADKTKQIHDHSIDWEKQSILSLSTLAHELSHIAQFELSSKDKKFPYSIENNEARAKMFEIYSLLHYLNAHYKVTNKSNGIQIQNKKVEIPSSEANKITFDNQSNADIVASSAEPHLKGYSIGVDWVLSKLNQNYISAKDVESLNLLLKALILDIEEKPDLTK